MIEQVEPRHFLSGVGLTMHLVAENDVNGPLQLRLADMDSDNDLDIVSGSLNDSRLAWFENAGGSFEDVHVVSDNSAIIFDIADLNGDDHADVVQSLVAGDGMESLAWQLNDGSGNFSEPTVITTEFGYFLGVAIRDFNGDGLNDIVARNQELAELSWYRNTGDGFADAFEIASGAIQGMRVEDFDGDGDEDIVVGWADGGVEVLENDGAGDFTSGLRISDESVRRPTVADLDGDQDPDILTEVGWFQNDGSGGFSSLVEYTQDFSDITNFDDDADVVAADFDGDGDLDLAVSDGNFIASYENIDGSGTLGPRHLVTENINNGSFIFAGIALAAGDLSGDGRFDLVSSSFSDNRIAWHENEGGVLGPQQIVSTTIAWVTSTDAADLDGDGDIDLLSSSIDDQKLAWYPNLDGQGDFGPQRIIDDDLRGLEFVSLEDLDGDGNQDLYYAAFQQDKVAFQPFIGGDEVFGAEQIITDDSDGVFSARVEDLDGDGNRDVLTTSWLDAQISWHRALDGEGNFGPRETILDIQTSVWPDLGDIDADGDIDLLVTAREDAELLFLENDGEGNFEFSSVILSDLGDAAASIQDDLDGDGDPDLALSNSGRFSWFENVGGVFEIEHVIAEEFGGAIWAWDVDDFDNDGDDDIVLTSSEARKSAWFENLGDGAFGEEQEISTDLAFESVDMQDVDQDGDLDLVGHTLWEVYWFESDLSDSALPLAGDADGDGRVTFDDFVILQANFGAQGAEHADGDFDGDGEVTFDDFVILSANFGAS